MQAFTKATAVIPLALFFKCRVQYESEKKPRYKHIAGKTLLVGNHKRMWDPVLMGHLYCFREIRILAADILYRKNRVFSWFLDVMGFIHVNREITDMDAVQQAVDTLERGGLVGIFPEGRLERGEDIPFKPGAVIAALRSGADIVPMYFAGPYGLFRRAGVVIGDRIDPKALMREDIPYEKALAEACKALSGKVGELKDIYENTIKKGCIRESV